MSVFYGWITKGKHNSCIAGWDIHLKKKTMYLWLYGVLVAACGVLFLHAGPITMVRWLLFCCGVSSRACGLRVDRLSSCIVAQLPHCMWDLSSLTRNRTVSSALEGRFLTPGPPRKSWDIHLWSPKLHGRSMMALSLPCCEEVQNTWKSFV